MQRNIAVRNCVRINNKTQISENKLRNIALNYQTNLPTEHSSFIEMKWLGLLIYLANFYTKTVQSLEAVLLRLKYILQAAAP